MSKPGRIVITPEFIDVEAPPIMRALIQHILDHADVVGEDRRGRSVLRFEFACPDWLLDKLAAFDAAREDLEDWPACRWCASRWRARRG